MPIKQICYLCQCSLPTRGAAALNSNQMTIKELSLKLSEPKYHAYPAWSYSLIARYAKKGFAALATLHDRIEPTPSMEFGSLFDSVITRGKRTLDSYAIYEKDIPAAEKRVLDMLAVITVENELSSVPQEVVAAAIKNCGYYPKWGYDAQYKHLSEYADYFRMIRSGKRPVSKTDWDDAMEMARVFRNDTYLKDLFGTKNTEDTEYVYQAQFVAEVMLPSGKIAQVKIMPDLLKINHTAKTVQPVDLKTSAMPAWGFKENFLEFRYDLQASVYSDILRIVMDESDDLHDYTILPYLFTDVSRTDKVPVTYVYDQTDITQTDGLCYTAGERTYSYKHWTVLLDEIITYEETHATVPSYISTTSPNNILEIIAKR